MSDPVRWLRYACSRLSWMPGLVISWAESLMAPQDLIAAYRVLPTK